jgi:hypothetical protein
VRFGDLPTDQALAERLMKSSVSLAQRADRGLKRE